VREVAGYIQGGGEDCGGGIIDGPGDVYEGEEG
jgi:hypothetical protein